MQNPDGLAYLIKEWIKYADNDELNVRALLKDCDGTPAQVCFLSQQIAEKYLKALILSATGDYPRVHDFNKLFIFLQQRYPDINTVKEDGVLLDPYYIGTRYPADVAIEHLTWDDAKQAYAAALRIKAFALGHVRNRETNGFGLIGILIVIAVIALIGGGGLYLRETQQQKAIEQIRIEKMKEAETLKQKIEQQQKQTQAALTKTTPPATSATTTIDTSNWKTYRNEKYGFEVRYPENMYVRGPEVYEQDGTTIKPSQFLLRIEDQKYRDYIEGEYPGFVISNYSWGDLGQSSTNFKREYSVIDTAITIHFPMNGQTLRTMCFLDQSKHVDMIPLCNQLLSTFKFIK